MTVFLPRFILALVPVAASLLAAKGIYHLFQLESYQFPGYFRAIKRNRVQAFLPGIAASAISMVIYYGYDLVSNTVVSSAALVVVSAVLCLIAALGGYGISKLIGPKKAKKKFVLTVRVKRLYAVSVLVMCAISLALAQSPVAILPALWPLVLPLVVALCGLLAWPVEKIISEFYFRDARRKLLSNPNLVRIGITGSYGKTSVKHIIGTILSEKYPTLITPASFNTPMGVSKAIRERLTNSHQVFVGEMGARHVGDIKEMTRLVRPTIGILTSVGPQHLETFKTVERVAKTKYELIDALPADGHAYFYDDQAMCRQLYDRTTKPKTLVSLSEGDADVWCKEVTVSAGGSAFELCIRNKGSIACQTKLLGTHNITNILLAAAVADGLGLTLKQIAHGISKLQPVQSRLELIANPGQFTIINDAFNSNPVSAKAALEALAQFPARRIIVTPGMVELGTKESEYNREFGRQIAAAADIAIIVGKKRTTPIIEGLTEAGFTLENIHRVDNLDASTVLLRSIVRKEDTVLYENDLPDNYKEA